MQKLGFEHISIIVVLALFFGLFTYVSVMLYMGLAFSGVQTHSYLQSALLAAGPLTPLAIFGFVLWIMAKGQFSWRVLIATLVPTPTILFLFAIDSGAYSTVIVFAYGSGIAAAAVWRAMSKGSIK